MRNKNIKKYFTLMIQIKKKKINLIRKKIKWLNKIQAKNKNIN